MLKIFYPLGRKRIEEGLSAVADQEFQPLERKAV
jgi:hypothetical protein